MIKQCACGSFAINPNRHGRDVHNTDLCDVCYWKDRAEKVEQQAARYRKVIERFSKCGDQYWETVAREALDEGEE